MSPKQKYDERKRLRIENDLRAEKIGLISKTIWTLLSCRLARLCDRIADVLELWADLQKDRADAQ